MTTGRDNFDWLSHLVGEQLSAVVFVMDYLQLQFDDYILSVMTPLVVSDGKFYTLEDSGYRDALCKRITQKVKNTILAEDYLQIDFDDKANFHISLKKEDYVGEEAINFYFPKSENKPLIVF